MRELLLILIILRLSLAASNSVKFRVKEEQDPGAFVGDVSQTDVPNKLRRGGFGKIRYKMQGLASQSLFEIGETTGILRTKVVLDRENLPSAAQGDVFQIQIKVATEAIAVSPTLPVEVRVEDINDHAPVFPQDFEALQISESAPEKTRFPLQRARDADVGINAIQTYRIVTGNDDDMFSLNLKRFSADMIYVYLVNSKRLDREKKDFYRLVIAAVDGGTPLPRSARKELNITISDSNDHSPEFTKDFYNANVTENKPNGTYVRRVNAVDKDIGKNGEIKFFLDQERDSHLFRIDEQTGEIWTNAVLDYEVKSEYRLTVTAQDQGPDSIPSKAQVSVKVIDKNDEAPSIAINPESVPNAPGPLFIPEDVRVGTNVAMITVKDGDSMGSPNSKVDISVTDHKHDFAVRKIFETLYNLEVQRPLNLTRHSKYTIQFIARDRGVPTLEANASLQLIIVDKNRNAPTFAKRNMELTIIDNAKPSSLVAVVTATDPDTDREGDLDYSIKSLYVGEKNVSVKDIGRFFTYGRKTGKLVVEPKLWCAFTPSFQLVLEARDNGRVPRSGETSVKITVQCAKYQYNFSIAENKPKGTIVGHVVVSTRAPGKQISFSLVSSGRSAFVINNATGLIRTSRRLDREALPTYDLVVLVSDGEVKMRLTCIVHVLDENDNAPIFISLNDNHIVEVPSNAKRGDEVVTIRATDPDEGRNGVVQYSLVSGNIDKTFILDKDRGELVVFNYMFQASYVLTIKSSDSGNPRKESFVRIRVKVVPPESMNEGTTALSTDIPVFDSRGSDEAFLESKTMLIVVALCSVFGLLIICGVGFLLFRCHRKQTGKENVQKGQKKPTQPPAPRESYVEPEISREAAIKASKKMYSQATVNMYPSNEMLDAIGKGKTGKYDTVQPLPNKSILQTSPPMSSIQRHGLPQYGDIYPPVSTSRPISEGFSSGDEIDSGKGDSSRCSSPYTSHTLGRRPNEYNACNPHHTMNHSQYPMRHINAEGSYKYPVVTMPSRNDKKKTIVSISNTPLAHAATDL